MFRSLLGKIESRKKNMTETVFGEPVTFSSVTIIPVARVTYSACAGSQGGSERPVANTQPLGYIEVKEENIRFISLFDPIEIVLLGAICAAGIFSVTSLLLGLYPRSRKAPEKKKEDSGKSGLSKYLTLAGVVASAAFTGALLQIRCCQGKKTDPCPYHGNVEDEYISVGEMEGKKQQKSSPRDKKGEELWDTPKVTIIDESMEPEA